MNTMATYTLKIPPGTPAVGSTEVQAWLRKFSLNCNAVRIAFDPGAGDRVLRLSLPADQVNALAAKLGNPPAVALRRLIATYVQSNPVAAYTQVVPARTRSTAPASWFDRHPVLALVLFLAGIAGLLWLLFHRNGGLPSVPGPLAPPPLVSQWSPLP
jgi:hypothetical protein